MLVTKTAEFTIMPLSKNLKPYPVQINTSNLTYKPTNKIKPLKASLGFLWAHKDFQHSLTWKFLNKISDIFVRKNIFLSNVRMNINYLFMLKILALDHSAPFWIILWIFENFENFDSPQGRLKPRWLNLTNWFYM